MSTLEYRLSAYDSGHIYEPTPNPLAGTFSNNLSARVHGEAHKLLAEGKPNARQAVLDFAHDLVPQEAIDVAEIAHLAELTTHETFGKNIRKTLNDTILNSEELSDDQKLYVTAIFSDLSKLAAYSKAMYVDQEKHLDLESLAETVRSINIESVVIKASLDYSNFLLLQNKERQLLKSEEELTDKEKIKMERTVASIRHIDSVLLEVLGFDALSAEILSKVYAYEVEKDGDGTYLEMARDFFDEIGPRNTLGQRAQNLLGDLFSHDDSTIYEVTNNQSAYDMHFTDGEVTIPELGQSFRTLTRLKSIGSTAMKMRNSALKNGIAEVPADIIGVTFIGDENSTIEAILAHVINQVDEQRMPLIAAPGRKQLVHIKGSRAFIDYFTREDSLLGAQGISVLAEECDNGYEAIKLTTLSHGCPVEMQFTHEASRQASRTGLGSHTLFKLEKLLGVSVGSHLTKEELLAILNETAIRKQDFNSDSLEIVEDSKIRAERLIRLCRHEAEPDKMRAKRLARTASHNLISVL